MTRRAGAQWLHDILSSRFSMRTHVFGLILVVITLPLVLCAFLLPRIAPQDGLFFELVRRSTWVLILASGVALMLAATIGHRIVRAITKLADYAEAVVRCKRTDLPATGILETDAVARSLYGACEQLRRSAQERAALLDRTITAHEAERRRIARELHDNLGQYLAALSVWLNAMESQCSANQTAHQHLVESKTLASALGRELHRIASELWPMALSDLGLERAVTQYLEEFAERSNLKVDLEIALKGGRLPQPVETTLFRALQETIGNVVEHAAADRVGIILETGDQDVRLIVEDDGRGFGAESSELGARHLGLLGLRERLALAGGTLEVESSEQGGTTVYMCIPLVRGHGVL